MVHQVRVGEVVHLLLGDCELLSELVAGVGVGELF